MTNAGRGGCGRINNPNRYRLHFESQSRAEMERRKRLAKSKTVDPLLDVSFMNTDSTSSVCVCYVCETEREREGEVVYRECLCLSVDDAYAPGTVLDIPKRPPWSYSMTKEQVKAQEEAMFEEYLKIYSQHKPD